MVKLPVGSDGMCGPLSHTVFGSTVILAGVDTVNDDVIGGITPGSNDIFSSQALESTGSINANLGNDH